MQGSRRIIGERRQRTEPPDQHKNLNSRGGIIRGIASRTNIGDKKTQESDSDTFEGFKNTVKDWWSRLTGPKTPPEHIGVIQD